MAWRKQSCAHAGKAGVCAARTAVDARGRKVASVENLMFAWWTDRSPGCRRKVTRESVDGLETCCLLRDMCPVCDSFIRFPNARGKRLFVTVICKGFCPSEWQICGRVWEEVLLTCVAATPLLIYFYPKERSGRLTLAIECGRSLPPELNLIA